MQGSVGREDSQRTNPYRPDVTQLSWNRVRIHTWPPQSRNIPPTLKAMGKTDRLGFGPLWTTPPFLSRLPCASPGYGKNICRIPQDSINILGAKEGESIVLTSIVREGHVFRRRNDMLNVFPISEAIRDGRNPEQRDEETDNPFVRYPRSDVILGVKPDISSIFLDFDARTELDVHCFDVVLAHHFLRATLIREIRDFGLVFFLSLLALTDVLEKIFGLQTTGAVLFSFALSVVVIMIRIVLYFHAGIK